MIMKSHTSAVALAVGVTFSATSFGAAAQDSVGGLEEIVVTARRREETAQSVPIPITVMTGEQLEERVANDIRDIARVTPNLEFVESGVNRSAAQVYLRGIGQSNWSPVQDPTVGVYLDVLK